jgi:hypothetical protein
LGELRARLSHRIRADSTGSADQRGNRMRKGEAGTPHENSSFNLAGTVGSTGYSVVQPHTRHILGILGTCGIAPIFAKYVPSMCFVCKARPIGWPRMGHTRSVQPARMAHLF